MAATLRLRALPLASVSDCPSFVIVATGDPVDSADLAADLRAGGLCLDAWADWLPTGLRTVEVLGPWDQVKRALEALGFAVTLDAQPGAIGRRGGCCHYCTTAKATEMMARGRPACGGCAGGLREDGPPLASVRAEAFPASRAS